MTAWLLLLAAVVCEVTATLCLRASEGFRRRGWIAPIVVLYVASFFLLSRTLAAGMPLGVAYGVWAAVGVALTALVSRVVLREPFSGLMAGGIALIAGGVLLIELGATTPVE